MKKYKKYRNEKGFTLVEVLICVGIVGIIAAISIPAILSSTSEKALETQRKALHSRMAQAFGQIKNLKAYEKADVDSGIELLANGLSRVYKITSVCDLSTLSQCGIPNSISDFYSDTESPYVYDLTSVTNLSTLNDKIDVDAWGGLDSNAVGFKTANGESILMFYNPRCKTKKEAPHNIVHSVCVNMIYDLNGKNQAPNSYGEDIGYITVFYPSDPVVVMPVLDNKKLYAESLYNTMLTTASNGLVPPTMEELTSILINKDVTNISKDISESDSFWSSSYISEGTDKIWTVGLENGAKHEDVSSGSSTKHQYFLVKK